MTYNEVQAEETGAGPRTWNTARMILSIELDLPEDLTMSTAQTKLHCIEYRHEGATWVIKVPATSQADALQRVCRMQEGTYMGTAELELPARLGFVAKSVCWLQSVFSTGRRSA